MGLFLIILGVVIAIATLVFVGSAMFSFEDGAVIAGVLALLVGAALTVGCFGLASSVAPSEWTAKTGTVSFVMITGDPNTVWITLTGTSNDYECSEPACLKLQPGDDVSFESGVPGYSFAKGAPVIRNITLTNQ